MNGLQDAINDAGAEPTVPRITPQPTDRADSLAPSPRPARRRRSSSRAHPPHRVEDEEAPEDPFNARSFQESLRDSKRAVAELANVLGSSALGRAEGSKLQQLRLEAVDLESFQHPTKRTVGFVGSSGCGASLRQGHIVRNLCILMRL